MSILLGRDRDIPNWTLRQAMTAGNLALECRKCLKLARPDVARLASQYGADAMIASLLAKAVCIRCGRRDPKALIHLRGIRGERAWVPRPPGAAR